VVKDQDRLDVESLECVQAANHQDDRTTYDQKPLPQNEINQSAYHSLCSSLIVLICPARSATERSARYDLAALQTGIDHEATFDFLTGLNLAASEVTRTFLDENQRIISVNHHRTAGTIGICCCVAAAILTVANMSGFSKPAGFGNRQRTLIVRVEGSTIGLMKDIRPGTRGLDKRRR